MKSSGTLKIWLRHTGCVFEQMGREVLGYVQQVLNSSQGQPKRPDCERRKRHATGNFSIQPFNRSALLVGLLSTGVLAANNEAGYRQVGDAYEALMLRNLYTQMQQANSMGDDDPDNQFAPSNAEKIFRGMRDEVMIQSLAKRRPLGVSDMIVRRLQGKGGVREGARVELNSGIQVQH